jgi:Methyltransferase domain
MHGAAYLWVADHVPDNPGHVLDIGGRNVNGSVRGLFPSAASWTCLDIMPGQGVDIVADAGTWTPVRPYDTILCLEVFEHTANWPDILGTIKRALSKDGYAILTMAGLGRAPHSGVDGNALRPGEHYGNVSGHALRIAAEEAGFGHVHVDVLGPDTRAVIW